MRQTAFPHQKRMSLEKGASSRLIDYGMEFPVVVKPCCGGASVGVFIVKNEAEYAQALLEAFSYER